RKAIPAKTVLAGSCCLSPTGNLVAVWNDRPNSPLLLCDWRTDKGPRALRARAFRFERVLFSPDGALLAAMGLAGEPVHIFDVASGRLLHRLRQERDYGYVMAFSPDSCTLVTVNYRPGDVVLWDPKTAKRRDTLTGPAFAQCLAFSPDGTLL